MDDTVYGLYIDASFLNYEGKEVSDGPYIDASSLNYEGKEVGEK